MATSTTTVTSVDNTGVTTTTTTTTTAAAAPTANTAAADSYTWGGGSNSWDVTLPIETLRPVFDFDALEKWRALPAEIENTGKKPGDVRTVHLNGMAIVETCLAVYDNGYAYSIDSDLAAFQIENGSYRGLFSFTSISPSTTRVTWTTAYRSSNHEATDEILAGFVTMIGACMDIFAGTLNAKVALSAFHDSPTDAPQTVAMSFDEITPAWLSGVFATEVLSFDKNICEGGQLANTCVLKNIKVKDGSVSRPTSVAVKLHVGIPEVRGLSVGMSAYSRELWFYQEGHKHSPITAPKPLFIATDGSAGATFFNLVMEDLTLEWDPAAVIGQSSQGEQEFLNVLKTQVIPQHAKFWEKYDFIAQPPLSTNGLKFDGLYGIDAFDDALPATLGLVNEHMPRLSFPEEGALPASIQKLFGLYGKLAENEAEGMHALRAEAKRIMNTRPQTWCHGDLNATNAWKGKKDPTTSLLADWQLTRMAPPAFDLVTAMVFLDAKTIGNGGALRILTSFHTELCRQQPAAKKDYPLKQFLDDVALLVATLGPMVFAIMAPQISADMPQEKKDFAWQLFWKNGWLNMCEIANAADMYTVVDEVEAKKYTRLGPRKD